jgi:hypothetical protein
MDYNILIVQELFFEEIQEIIMKTNYHLQSYSTHHQLWIYSIWYGVGIMD